MEPYCQICGNHPEFCICMDDLDDFEPHDRGDESIDDDMIGAYDE